MAALNLSDLPPDVCCRLSKYISSLDAYFALRHSCKKMHSSLSSKYAVSLGFFLDLIKEINGPYKRRGFEAYIHRLKVLDVLSAVELVEPLSEQVVAYLLQKPLLRGILEKYLVTWSPEALRTKLSQPLLLKLLEYAVAFGPMYLVDQLVEVVPLAQLNIRTLSASAVRAVNSFSTCVRHGMSIEDNAVVLMEAILDHRGVPDVFKVVFATLKRMHLLDCIAKMPPYMFARSDCDMRIIKPLVDINWAAKLTSIDDWFRDVSLAGNHRLLKYLITLPGTSESFKPNMCLMINVEEFITDSYVKFLIEKCGADPNYQMVRRDGGIETPLSLALESDAPSKAVKFLLKMGAGVTPHHAKSFEVFCTLLLEGETALCTLFLKKGFDINSRNKDGFTPLHYIAHGGFLSHKPVVFLLSNGANIDAIEPIEGRSPLMLALEASPYEYDSIEMLLNYGASISLLDANGLNAIDIAIDREDIDLIERLNNYAPGKRRQVVRR